MSTRCPRSRWRSLGVHAQLPAKGPRDRRRFRRCLHWPPGPVVDDAPTCASGSRLVPAGEAQLLHRWFTNDAIAQRVHEPRGSGGAVHLRCARSERLHWKRRSAGRDQQRAARRAPQELPLTTLTFSSLLLFNIKNAKNCPHLCEQAKSDPSSTCFRSVGVVSRLRTS